jgi:hypothetical protein
MIIRILAATIGGGIVLLILGFAIYGILLADFFTAHTVPYEGLVKEMPDFLPLIIFHLAWAGLTAFVFDYWAGIKTFAGGLKGGAIISFGVLLIYLSQISAFLNYYTDVFPILVDLLIGTASGAVGGGIIGLILGKMDRE